ncbi:hypothetical protein P7K49_038778 [Saguinus oedipus]|uniref:Uncharacterized protein n=1 Tax=Saguinus oedipus TaxID=9490 RepID=A0ABQ9TH77_SAGOE|nr:hypothetical protein P7K49_038778 [Saguinus oedipus]
MNFGIPGVVGGSPIAVRIPNPSLHPSNLPYPSGTPVLSGPYRPHNSSAPPPDPRPVHAAPVPARSHSGARMSQGVPTPERRPQVIRYDPSDQACTPTTPPPPPNLGHLGVGKGQHSRGFLSRRELGTVRIPNPSLHQSTLPHPSGTPVLSGPYRPHNSSAPPRDPRPIHAAPVPARSHSGARMYRH